VGGDEYSDHRRVDAGQGPHRPGQFNVNQLNPRVRVHPWLRQPTNQTTQKWLLRMILTTH
jgi:hypothetical protein